MQTIQDYITAARVLLQDVLPGAYRYTDDKFRVALTLAFDEAFRLRPDMFVKVTLPDFMTASMSTDVPAPRGYQSAFLYYIAGQVTLSDQEDTQDSRAAVFLNKFVAQMTTSAA